MSTKYKGGIVSEVAGGSVEVPYHRARDSREVLYEATVGSIEVPYYAAWSSDGP